MTLPSSLQGQPHPLPTDLRQDLPDYWTPWKVSDQIFGQMGSQKGKYKKIEILPTDPEWRFVWRYFYHDKPYKYGIKHIYCVHERHQQQAFESNIASMEVEVKTCPPRWREEPRGTQRIQAIERWKETTNLFSPFHTIEADGRHRNWKDVKILPLWHGTSEKSGDLIAASGFLYFGKTNLGGSSSKDPTSTDEGFFGSGIYFTSSARYAGDIYAKGHLLLAWVSMREPFPVVGDPQQQDMETLKGKGAYKHYNAHYVPVTSINPLDPYEAIYHPAKEGITPHCDEIVIFHKSQALPRFWIELQVEAPYKMNPSDIPQFVEDLIPHLFKILENPEVDKDKKLRNYLGQELGILLKLKGDDYLEDHGNKYETLYKNLSQLIEVNGKINRNISRLIVGLPPPSSSTLSPTTQQQETQVQNPVENPTFSSFLLNIFSNIFQPTVQNPEKAKVEPPLPSNSNPSLTTEIQKLQIQPTPQNVTPLSFQSNTPSTKLKATSTQVTSSPSTTTQKQQTQVQTTAQNPISSSFLSTVQNSEVNSSSPTKPMSPSSISFKKATVGSPLPLNWSLD